MFALSTKEWIIIAISCLAFFMDGLDGSIAMIALPTITAYYGVGIDLSTWVLIGYLLIICAFILPMGKIVERHGVKYIFILGFAIFAGTSLICAYAPTIWILIAARLTQGLGACMLAAAAPALLALKLPSSICGYAFGMIGAASAIAFAFGPVIGGILVEYLSWQWIFLINVPIGVIAVAISLLYIDPDKNEAPKTRLDYEGAFLIAGTASLLLILVNGWSVYPLWISVVLIGASCAMGYGALKWEKGREDPIIPLALIYDTKMQKVLIALCLGVGVCTGFLFVLPFYMEVMRGISPAIAGLYLFLPAFLAAVISPFAGKEMDRRGGRIVTSIGALATVLTSAFFLIEGMIDVFFLFILSLFLFGTAMGLFQGPASGRIISVAKKEWYALASAFVSMCIYFGASIGTALFSGILSFYYNANSGTNTDFFLGWTAICIIALIMSIIAWYYEWVVPDIGNEA